jgi:hypothetical protein
LELAKSSRNVLLAVQAELFHLHFKSWVKTAPIALGNSVVQSLGFHPTDKIRALKDLEIAGWITVQWRKRQSPLVMIVKGFKLVDQISRARLPKFALACGVLVLFWNFSGYVEQILWIPLISFGFSILSVYFYCRYLDSARATADYFVVSALATYSIQCGVPIAVFLLSLFRRQETTGGWRLSAPVCGAIKDTVFFGILFVLFIQVWITTSGPASGFFHLDPGRFLKHFLKSIANLFWHYDTSYLIRSLNQHWPLWLVEASLGVSAILFY